MKWGAKGDPLCSQVVLPQTCSETMWEKNKRLKLFWLFGKLEEIH